MIQHRFGVRLTPRRRATSRHARSSRIDGEPAEVNSYHDFGATETRPPLEAWAFAEDGVVKAVRHAQRTHDGHDVASRSGSGPFAPRDIALFRQLFGVR